MYSTKVKIIDFVYLRRPVIAYDVIGVVSKVIQRRTEVDGTSHLLGIGPHHLTQDQQ